MSLNVVIMTTPGEGFHKHLCASIAARHNVVGIVHPILNRAGGGFFDLKAHRRAIEKKGFAFHFLTKLGDNKFKKIGWNLEQDVAEAEAGFFPDAQTNYDAIDPSIIHHVENINGENSVALMKSLSPDVIINSGGPIYKKDLIETAPLMLNYHTGISPIYNGSESIFWPFVNGHPHITGGTLMVMNAGVDAGDMLAHFLPHVEAGDTPGRQFMKTIAGGIELYDKFLTDLSGGKPYVGVPQGPPLHYTISADWTAHQNLMIERRVKKDVCKKFERGEREQVYWRNVDQENAKRAYEKFLLQLINDL